MKGYALVLAVVLAGGFVAASSPESHSATTNVVRLKAISSRVTSTGTSLVIEASEPVPTWRRVGPADAHIDFRNVAADGLTSVVAARRADQGVAVEPAVRSARAVRGSACGCPAAVAHHVRADRNMVVIDFGKSGQGRFTFATSARTKPGRRARGHGARDVEPA
jgi:hypothetical protein